MPPRCPTRRRGNRRARPCRIALTCVSGSDLRPCTSVERDEADSTGGPADLQQHGTRAGAAGRTAADAEASGCRRPRSAGPGARTAAKPDAPPRGRRSPDPPGAPPPTVPIASRIRGGRTPTSRPDARNLSAPPRGRDPGAPPERSREISAGRPSGADAESAPARRRRDRSPRRTATTPEPHRHRTKPHRHTATPSPRALPPRAPAGRTTARRPPNLSAAPVGSQHPPFTERSAPGTGPDAPPEAAGGRAHPVENSDSERSAHNRSLSARISPLRRPLDPRAGHRSASNRWIGVWIARTFLRGGSGLALISQQKTRREVDLSTVPPSPGLSWSFPQSVHRLCTTIPDLPTGHTPVGHRKPTDLPTPRSVEARKGGPHPQGLGTTGGSAVDGGVDNMASMWTTSGRSEVVHDSFRPSTGYSQSPSTAVQVS